MSIIHEALKKAASEGTAEISKSISHSHLFRASAQAIQISRWVATGMVFLVLSIFLFSVRYPFSISRNLYEGTTRSEISPSNPKADSEIPQSEQLLNNNIEKTSVLPDPRIEEGERALISGIKLYHDGKIEESRNSLAKAVEMLPLSAVAHNNLGMVLRHQGKTNEALRHYQEAIRLNSNYAEAENNIGLIYDKRGAIDQAAIHYKRAIDIKPTVPVFHLNYATLLERKGDFSNARKEYQIYLDFETDPKSEGIPLVRTHLNKLKGF
jgi:tetratricopeptide (TPR) repeat protein